MLDALLEDARLRVRDPQTGTLEGDLRQFLGQTFRALGRTGDVVRVLMAEAQIDPAFADLFRTRFVARRREALRALLVRARQRGEIATAVDLDLLMDLAFGPMWYRLLNRHARLDAALARALARSVVSLARPPDAKPAVASPAGG